MTAKLVLPIEVSPAVTLKMSQFRVVSVSSWTSLDKSLVCTLPLAVCVSICHFLQVMMYQTDFLKWEDADFQALCLVCFYNALKHKHEYSMQK